MTIIGTHRGPISGITHVHLLRESAAERAERAERAAKSARRGTLDRPDASKPDRSGENQDSVEHGSKRRAGGR
jgi:hypothetical protein